MRHFVLFLCFGVTLAASAGLAADVAITMDDPTTATTPLLNPQERDIRILEALRKNGDLKVVLFVCGKRVDSQEGRALLMRWTAAGQLLGNHSYSHLYYHSQKISFDQYVKDFLAGEKLVEGYSNFRKWFRFPFLKEGGTLEKRDEMRVFLKDRGYRNGSVTIDASDWYIDERMQAALVKDPKVDLNKYRDYYLAHIWDRANYYDGLAKKVLGKTVKHTLLIHHNLLNALFLNDLLEMFRSKGWKLINADQAFEDSVFQITPNVLPAGESLLWSLAKETGKYDSELRYPGEDGEYQKDEMDRLAL